MEILPSHPQIITPDSTVTFIASDLHDNQRIDSVLTNQFPAYSRTFFQENITKQWVKINNTIISKPSVRVKTLDSIEVYFPPVEQFSGLPLPETDLGVQVVYENDYFMVVYKPAGLIVHHSAHTTTATLVDWLVNHFQELKTVGSAERPGIVHRLDKETSGILLVPKTNYAHMVLSDMFKNRKVQKTYIAAIQGIPAQSGTIDFPITRDPIHHHKMTHKIARGRESLTHYETERYFKDSALVHVFPVTGRTHQIRVHFTAIGHPIIGDKTYGCSSPLIERQALHAYSLSFIFLGKYYSFVYDIPEDMRRLIQQLDINSVAAKK